MTRRGLYTQVWFCDYCRALGIAVHDEVDAYGMGHLVLSQHAKASPACTHDPRAINEKVCKGSTILLEGTLPREETSPMTTQRDLYMVFMKGWRAGAGGKALDPSCTGHLEQGIRGAYNAGYESGRMQANEASKFASLQYGYKPSILRTQGPLTSEDSE